MKRAIHELSNGDWFIATLDNEQSVFVAGKMRSDGQVRTCTNLSTGDVGEWSSGISVEKIDPDTRDYLLDEAQL